MSVKAEVKPGDLLRHYYGFILPFFNFAKKKKSRYPRPGFLSKLTGKPGVEDSHFSTSGSFNYKALKMHMTGIHLQKNCMPVQVSVKHGSLQDRSSSVSLYLCSSALIQETMHQISDQFCFLHEICVFLFFVSNESAAAVVNNARQNSLDHDWRSHYSKQKHHYITYEVFLNIFWEHNMVICLIHFVSIRQHLNAWQWIRNLHFFTQGKEIKTGEGSAMIMPHLQEKSLKNKALQKINLFWSSTKFWNMVSLASKDLQAFSSKPDSSQQCRTFVPAWQHNNKPPQPIDAWLSNLQTDLVLGWWTWHSSNPLICHHDTHPSHHR